MRDLKSVFFTSLLLLSFHFAQCAKVGELTSYDVKGGVPVETSEQKVRYYRSINMDGSFHLIGKNEVPEVESRTGSVYKLIYNDDAHLERMDFLTQGAKVETDFYFGVSSIHFEYMKDSIEKRSYYNTKGRQMRDRITNVFSVNIRYNVDDNTVSLYNYDKNNMLIRDQYGVAHYLCYLDERGRRISSVRFDASGNRVIDKEGFYELRTYYDDEGNVVEQRNYDKDGKLMDDKWYISVIKRQYDNRSNLIEESYYGPEGHLKLHSKMGVAIVKREYDDNSKLIMERYYGIDRQLRERVKYKGLYFAMIRFEYGPRGELKKVKFLDRQERVL